MGKLRIEYVRTETLKENPGQPQTRYNDASYQRLKRDIAEHGIHDPLDVHPDGTLEDGHRRWKCAQELGIEEVPVIVTNSEDWMVRSNETRRQMRGTEYLQSYLQGRGLPTTTAGRQIRYLEDLGGTALLQRLTDEGISPSVWGRATAVCTYCDVEKTDSEKVLSVLNYLIRGRRQSLVKAAMEGHISLEVLWLAIQQDRDPVQRWG